MIDCSIEQLAERYRRYLCDRCDSTVTPYLVILRRFASEYNKISTHNVSQFIARYDNANSYNNAVKALKHLGRMYGIELPIKVKPVQCEKLIIAPSKETVLQLISGIKDKQVKAYLTLCATTGIRVRRLLRLKWEDIDISNGFVLRKIEHRRTKWYRPNPLHKDAREMLLQLERKGEDIFAFSEHRVRGALMAAKLPTPITPTQLRDFFYNQAITCGMNTVIVEWLMGHDIGIAKHYLADNIKAEYIKFGQSVNLS